MIKTLQSVCEREVAKRVTICVCKGLKVSGKKRVLIKLVKVKTPLQIYKITIIFHTETKNVTPDMVF